MRALFAFAAFLLLASGPSRGQDTTDTAFSNFGGTDYFPASSGTVPLTNTQLAAPGDNFEGTTGLNTGASSLPTGGAPSSVPAAGFTGGPSLNSGGAPSSVPNSFVGQ